MGHSSLAQQRKPISVGEPPPDSLPEAELATFKVLDGFQVNLFASEKDGVPNPLVMRWDERGRLWVISTTAYPQPAPDEPINDKILILEDTDHDGHVDKITTFADGLRMPMGMELAPFQISNPKSQIPTGHSVYVGEGEKLWLMTDTDGDDKVDTKEVVFSGFGTGDAHQNLNSFVWSPDGALVMHQGLHCYSKVSTAWGTKTLYGAGFWHYRPRSGRLDAYPTGMPLNPWGTVFTNDGQPIMVAGAAGMYWARPMEVSTADTEVRASTESKSIPHFLLERFQLPYGGQCIKTEGLTKFCGIDLVGNAHWPDAMQGEIVVGGFFNNKVFRFKLRDDPEFASGIEAVEQEALITSDSVAFRPIDIRFGPEGACYIADWYDPIIGHYQASFRHPNRDKAHGRIWRVRSKNKEFAKLPDFPNMKPEELAGSWNKDNRWQSYQSARLLQSAFTADEALTASTARIERRKLLEKPLASDVPDRPNPRPPSRAAMVRVWQNQLQWNDTQTINVMKVGEMFEETDSDFVSGVVRSFDPQIRAYATHSIGIFADRIPDALKLISARTTDDSPRVRLEAVVAAAKVPQPEAIKVALKVLDKPIDSYIDRALWLAVNATAKRWKPLTVDFMKDMAASHIAFLIKHEGSQDLREQAAALLQKDIPANVVEGLRLGLAKEDKKPNDLAREETARLQQAGNDAAKLEALAASTTAKPRLRDAALAKLTKADPARAGQFVAKGLDDLKSVEAMKAMLAPLLPVEAATKALTQALKTKPCNADAAKLILRVLTSTGRNEPELLAALGQSTTVPGYDPAWVNALAAEVKASGNATKGKTVFASTLTNCVACHSIAKQGGTIGPELDAVGRGVPVELLIEAVTWPNRQIKEGYIATNIVTKDGRRLMGYKVSDANGELQLRDFLGGTTSKFAAAEIASRTDAGSLMPEGLVALMTREELRDLIAYLMSLGR